MNTEAVPPPIPSSFWIFKSLAWVTVFVALTDILLWKASSGVSLGLVFVLWPVMGMLACGKRLPVHHLILLGILLLVSAVQCAWEICFSNVIVLSVLAAWILGNIHYRSLNSGWGIFVEAIWNIFRAPFRWGTVIWGILKSCTRWGGVAGAVAAAMMVLLPALILAGVFLFLLAGGNAVLAHEIDRALGSVWHWLLSWEFDLGRLFFWGFVATLALAWVLPYACPARRRWWDFALNRGNKPALGYIKWVSLSSLASVNAVFLLANSIDTIFLWWGGNIPYGVKPSTYLHEGVTFLIIAVLLASVVLVTIFQQSAELCRHRWIRVLAMLWILQNLLILAGVVCRLKLYVEAFQWSEQRIYVGFFVILVAVGFILLARYGLQYKSLGWLFWRNAQAVFVLFFIVQFLDVRGAVARWNVEQWERNPCRELDVAYLVRLGPSAWPELYHVASLTEPTAAQRSARAGMLAVCMDAEKTLKEYDRDWRSWQGRKAFYAHWLRAQKTEF